MTQRQYTRNIINHIKSIFGIKFYLVDLNDDALIYIGTFKNCKATINASYGGVYGIGTRKEVLEIEGIEEQIANLQDTRTEQ
jgi:hypothetical protein